MKEFELIGSGVETKYNDDVLVYERHGYTDNGFLIEYSVRKGGEEVERYECTKNPEQLADLERYEVLDYVLGEYDKDEIVNYLDLFIHGKHLTKVENSINKSDTAE